MTVMPTTLFQVASGEAEAAAVAELRAGRASAPQVPPASVDTGLIALAVFAAAHRQPADPAQLAHDLGLGGRPATIDEIARAARRIGFKCRILRRQKPSRLATAPLPAIIRHKGGAFAVLLGRGQKGDFAVFDPITGTRSVVARQDLIENWSGDIILGRLRNEIAREQGATFGFSWFLPSIWRYRLPLTHVLFASLAIQIFALVTPLLFQVVIDKVLVHNGLSTLLTIVIALVVIGLFEVILQYLRLYALSHTTSRIDVELGARLFDHLLRLPIAYFENRPAGQTVARLRELETIRAFLTGQGLTSAIDLLFTVVFIAVLFAYSTLLTMIVLCSIPCYLIVALVLRPILRARINERFDRAAYSQQFLVETVFGMQTLKAAAVEPTLRNQWEERLAAYVSTSFNVATLGALGQNAILYINKVTTALVLFFGAMAVMNGELSVGGLVAFNMIMGQVTAPIMRLSQLWQDFQQVQTSVERLGDVLNVPVETRRFGNAALPPAMGAIRLSDVTFRYRSDSPPALRQISLDIPAGQVLGIVGPSGSGKSTLTKLLQRLYPIESGQIFIDGMDIGQVDVAWLRRQIGVVLQENILFDRTIHENIALAVPAIARAQVVAAAKLAGADEFISKMPLGYDTHIVERGANLSGGQRQRIAIARALIIRPRVLILDEATSALDYESERIIQNNMRQIVQGRTVIIIAHRLAAVRNCDRIIALKDGALIEDGTHSQLLANPSSLYGRLWRMQSEPAGTEGA